MGPDGPLSTGHSRRHNCLYTSISRQPLRSLLPKSAGPGRSHVPTDSTNMEMRPCMRWEWLQACPRVLFWPSITVCMAYPLHGLMETPEESWAPKHLPSVLVLSLRITDHLDGTFTLPTPPRESLLHLPSRNLEGRAEYGIAAQLPMGPGRKARLVGQAVPA